LYANRSDGTNYPDNRLESDSFSATASTEFKITDAGFADENIEAGLYWIAMNPVNIPVGSIIEISGHDPTGATVGCYFFDDGGTNVMLSCMGFLGTDTSLPVTADSDMTPIPETVGALWMQVEPNSA
jgi:3D (Asp-Asp-Asp) domain-containing protein